jgi:ABC-type multidrug transport system fused ATPase/permease subunit
LNHDLFGLDGVARNIATLLFEMGFYYTAFQSQFIRETLAFPLVLLSFWISVRIAKNKNRAYAPIAFILIVAVILSHQISSYLFFLILALMTLSFLVFRHNNRLSIFLFLTVAVLGAYTSFVALSFSATEWMFAFEGIQAILNKEGSYTILKSSSSLMVYLSLAHYAILSVCVLVGGIKLLKEKKKDLALLTIIAFFTLAFVISVLLRLSTSADPWSWTYYMGLRGTIWAFLGISVVATVAIVYIFKLSKVSWKNSLALLFLVCILAVGKFSQYPPLITDSSNTPVTYPRYVAALWLKGETIHGSNMLVAPYQLDANAFEASRDMAPYAYLKEYFIEELKGRVYDGFRGYIPFVGDYFDQYKNGTDVHIIYSNGKVQVGYKPR